MTTQPRKKILIEGVIIPPGDYQFNRFRVEVQSSRHRPWRVGASIWFGDFTQNLGQLKLVYAFTPDLILSSFTQYDSESRDLGLNNRLRWTLRPGRDLFVVWNHGWRHPLESHSGTTLTPINDSLVAKLRWTFRW